MKSEKWNIQKHIEESKKEYIIKVNGVELSYLEDEVQRTIGILKEMKVDTEDKELMKGTLIKQYYDLLKKIKKPIN